MSSVTGASRVFHIHSLLTKEGIFERIMEVVFQLRRKLCSPEFLQEDPNFLKEYDRGLTLEEALQQFSELWRDFDREQIILACKHDYRSNGGNVILRLAGKKGCLELFKIIGLDILRENKHGHLDKEFKGHFCCHYLEAAIRRGDEELFQSLLDLPEVQQAIHAKDVDMPTFYHKNPYDYVKDLISKMQMPNRTKFTSLLYGEKIDSDLYFIRLFKDYLSEEKQEEAVQLLKVLVAKHPSAPLSGSAAVMNFYREMLKENPNHFDPDLFPQGEELSFEQRLSFLFTLKPDVIQKTIDELAQDDQRCEKLCSREIYFTSLYNVLAQGRRNRLNVYQPIKEALKEIRTLLAQRSSITGKMAEELQEFLRKIPLITLALIAREEEPLILPYLSFMESFQLKAVVPQMSKEELFQYLRTSTLSGIGILQAAIEEQADYFVDQTLAVFQESVKKAAEGLAPMTQYLDRLDDLSKREDLDVATVCQMYWESDGEFSHVFCPILTNLTSALSMQQRLKDRVNDLGSTLRSRCSFLKQPAIVELENQIEAFTVPIETYETAISSFAGFLEKIRADFFPKPPEEFLCPISYNCMERPLKDPYGHSYEAKEILTWLQKKHTSPLTGRPLWEDDLVENKELKERIEAWKEEYRTFFPKK